MTDIKLTGLKPTETDRKELNNCDCEDKIILVEGSAMTEARETFCPKHGYYTDCFLCGHGSSTEFCLKHRQGE